MKRLALLSAVLLLSSAAPAADLTPRALVDRVSAADGALTFGDFRLGMTLEQAAAAAGHPLTLSAGSEGVKTTERYATSVTAKGVTTDLSFESDSPESALIFIRARYPAGAAADKAALLDALKARVPALEPVDGSPALLLPGTDYQVAPQDDGLCLGANWLF